MNKIITVGRFFNVFALSMRAEEIEAI